MLRTLHLAHSVAAASVRVYNLTTEGKEFLPGSSLNHLGYGSRDHDLSLFLVFALWLLIFQWFSCLAQLHLRTWVNPLLTLVQSLFFLFFFPFFFFFFPALPGVRDMVGQSSRSSAERLGDFSSKSVVSHLIVVCFVFWFCFGFLLSCLGFVLEDTWLCSHLFFNMWE